MDATMYMPVLEVRTSRHAKKRGDSYDDQPRVPADRLRRWHRPDPISKALKTGELDDALRSSNFPVKPGAEEMKDRPQQSSTPPSNACTAAGLTVVGYSLFSVFAASSGCAPGE